MSCAHRIGNDCRRPRTGRRTCSRRARCGRGRRRRMRDCRMRRYMRRVRRWCCIGHDRPTHDAALMMSDIAERRRRAAMHGGVVRRRCLACRQAQGRKRKHCKSRCHPRLPPRIAARIVRAKVTARHHRRTAAAGVQVMWRLREKLEATVSAAKTTRAVSVIPTGTARAHFETISLSRRYFFGAMQKAQNLLPSKSRKYAP